MRDQRGSATILRCRVRTPDGSSIAGARVFFMSSPVPVPEIAALSDDGGRVVLAAPAPGHYEIGAGAEGFDTASAGFDVGDEVEKSLEIVLTPFEQTPGEQ